VTPPVTRISSFVDDTRVKKGIDNPAVDCGDLQSNLQSVYDWAVDVGLEFNSKKFECLRYWPRGNTPTQSYLSPAGTPIEEKPHLRDLGVEMSCDLSFSIHIDKVITCAAQNDAESGT
jgi:hypothetical protein